MDIDSPPPRNSLQDLRQRRATTASLISRLMNHYWTMDDPPAIRRAQAEDWIADLVEFAPAMIEAACVEWRRTETRRPTIADIRQRCIAAAFAEQERRLLRSPEARHTYARSLGYASEDERLAAIAADVRRRQDA